MSIKLVLFLIPILYATPAHAFFSVTVPEEPTKPQQVAASTNPNLKPVPKAALRIGLSRNVPAGVLSTQTQFEILDGKKLTQDVFKSPTPGGAGQAAPVVQQKPEPSRIEIPFAQIGFSQLIPEIVEKVQPQPVEFISTDEYIPKGGLVRTNSAERVIKDTKGALSLVDVANHLGLDHIEFLALMSWESGGTLNPNAMGGDSDLYKGLIQFSPGNQRKYGTTEQQSIRQQAPAVFEYLLDRGFKPGEHDIRHAYAAILVGTANENYRHPRTGRLAWDIPDSNKTTVRNAYSKFRSGPHHARAKKFLEDSLGEELQEQPTQRKIEVPIVTISF